MKTVASVAVAVALAAAVLAVPAAQAHAPRTVGHRTSTTKRLRIRLRRTQAALARAKADLADTRSRLADSQDQSQGLQAQASQLQGTLTQTAATLSQTQAQLAESQAQAASLQAQLAESQAREASLQAQLGAIPPPLAIAEEQVRREVEYETENALPDSQGRLVSQAAMDYVVGHVSVAAYGYLEIFALPLPLATADSVLGLQAGICGHAALTFAAIVKSFGYQVRSVQFYYTDPAGPAGPGSPDSHIADEVFYDGGWHFFDPTFGVYWTDADGNALAVTDVRSSGGTEVKDGASFTNLAEDYLYGDGTAFVTDPATTVVLDGQVFH